MAGKMADLDTLHEEVGKMRPHSVAIRMLAVTAELEEQAKAKREATQAEIARRYGASGRMLRYWVGRYRNRGLKGLEDDGGRGAKPRYPREAVQGVVIDCLDKGDGEGGKGGGKGKPGCKACELAKEGKKPARAPPKPCPCKGRCVTKGKRGKGCSCEKGKACVCRCCRPIRLRPRGPCHAPGCPNGRVSPWNGTSVTSVRAAMEESLGGSYSDRHLRRIMKGVSMTR